MGGSGRGCVLKRPAELRFLGLAIADAPHVRRNGASARRAWRTIVRRPLLFNLRWSISQQRLDIHQQVM